jgi:light-regulated signal transduction histidine kinase (bacteriophytochrome)
VVDVESFLNRRSRIFLFSFALVLNCLVGFADYLSGKHIGVEAFYLLPIFFVTWFISTDSGLFMSLISMATIVAANLPKFYEHPVIEGWNLFMHFCFFVIFTLLLSRIHRTLEEHSNLVAQLQRANKDMENFTYAASHDLRSPLIAIAGFSRILREDYADSIDEKGQDLLNRIEGSAKKMSQLIDDLLSFGRVSTREIRRSQVDMEKLAARVFEDLKPLVGQRDIRFEVSGLPPAFGDLSMLRQVIVNFITNALKFTRARETPLIEVGGCTEEKENIYFVRDNGVGFDSELSEKLFGMFQRLHSTQQFEGTGIGLFMIKQIIEKHGGRVWAEGEPDKGATFYFSLPRRDVLSARVSGKR